MVCHISICSCYDYFYTFSGDDEDKNEAYKQHKQLCKAMLLCICYSANIGGTGTLTGTAPQLVLAGQVSE